MNDHWREWQRIMCLHRLCSVFPWAPITGKGFSFLISWQRLNYAFFSCFFLGSSRTNSAYKSLRAMTTVVIRGPIIAPCRTMDTVQTTQQTSLVQHYKLCRKLVQNKTFLQQTKPNTIKFKLKYHECFIPKTINIGRNNRNAVYQGDRICENSE